MKFKNSTVYIAVLIVLLLLTYWMFQPAAVKVEIGKVHYGMFTQTIDEDAKTRAIKTFTVTAPVAGKMLRIDVKEGDQVKEGQVVAVIEPLAPSILDIRTRKEMEEQLGSVQAAYEEQEEIVQQTQTALKTSQSDYARNKTLTDKGYVSKSEFEHIELDMALKEKINHAAIKKLQSLKHEIEKLKISLSTHPEEQGEGIVPVSIRAPVTGRILHVPLKSESTIDAGTTILELADVSSLEVVAEILSADAARIPPHARVLMTGWGGEEQLEGVVKTVEPGAFTKVSALGVEEQRVNVVIDFTSPYAMWDKLGDAYRIDVAIVIYESPHALLVPMSAVFRDQQDWAVFVVKNNRAVKQSIKFMHHNADYAVVDSGLSEGDSVVLYPGGLVEEGALLRA